MAPAPHLLPAPPLTDESAPLRLALREGGGLATIVGIGGGFSRALGAQLGCRGEETAGDLSDHCLERALAAELANGSQRRVLRFGAGSPFIDVQLPCGGAIDIALDPEPDRAILCEAIERYEARKPFALALPLSSGAPWMLLEPGEQAPEGYFLRTFVPPLRMVVAGSGAEPVALAKAARGIGIHTSLLLPEGTASEEGATHLRLGARPDLPLDRYCALVSLFHDHEWERGVLPWMLESDALYIGVLGSAATHARRTAWLDDAGIDPKQIARISAPIGLIDRCREPASLAVSILAEIVARLNSQPLAA